MRVRKGIVSLALLAASVPAIANAADLQQGTLKAWNEYIRGVDAGMRDRLAAGRPFLWTDESSDRAARVRRGEVMVAPVVERGLREVPGGLIHDWIGAAFIPNSSIEGLLAVVHDYDRYKDIYTPVVADSKALACTATDQEFSMTWRRRVLFVNAAMAGRYRGHDFAVDARRGYNIAETTSVQEIEEYGRQGERLLPAGTGNGFLWRLHSVARYEERDGGVYLELEATALTRDIPPSLRWLVSPMVNHLSINSLTTTLRQTREAVKSVPPERLALCPERRLKAMSARPGGED